MPAEQARKTVAVFDPEARSRAVILPMLDRLGYLVDEHHDAAQITHRCQGQARADLVFLHLAVLGETYPEVTAGLQRLALASIPDAPPVLAISVLKLSEEARERLERLGCSCVLSRQAPLMEVVFAINRLLFPKIRELRRYTRVFGGFPIRFGQGQAWTEAEVYNISREGAFVQCAEPPAAGSLIQLRFGLPGVEEGLGVQAVVAWCNRPGEERDPLSPQGMGIHFLGLDSEAQTTLGRFIDRRGNETETDA